MGIFNAHQVEHALHRPIFTRNAMQCVKHDIGAKRGQNLRNIAVHVDTADLIAHFLKRISHAIAAHQRHRPFV